MNLFYAITAKPWENSGKPQHAIRPARAAGRTGLAVFMVVVTVLFFLLATAFYGRMPLEDWQPLAEPRTLWFNSVVLIVSSGALHWAWKASTQNRRSAVRVGIIVGCITALAFLAGQLVGWKQLVDAGYFAATNPANAFFYMITGLHGLHLAGGIAALALLIGPYRDMENKAKQLRLRLELCTTYWHFLLLVWFLIFAMMISDNSGKFDLLAICRGLLTDF